MCALRAYIKPPIFENIFSRIEKVLTIFLIFKKIFLKLNDLICTLRVHVSKIHYIKPRTKRGLKNYYKPWIGIGNLKRCCLILWRLDPIDVIL